MTATATTFDVQRLNVSSGEWETASANESSIGSAEGRAKRHFLASPFAPPGLKRDVLTSGVRWNDRRDGGAIILEVRAENRTLARLVGDPLAVYRIAPGSGEGRPADL